MKLLYILKDLVLVVITLLMLFIIFMVVGLINVYHRIRKQPIILTEPKLNFRSIKKFIKGFLNK